MSDEINFREKKICSYPKARIVPSIVFIPSFFFFFAVPPLSWKGAIIIIIMFFLPPFRWLGVIIMLLFFALPPFG